MLDRVQYFIHLANSDKPLSENDKMELQLLLRDLDAKYDEGKPLIENYDYDIIQELAIYEGAVRRSSESNNYGERVQHPIDVMRGTLHKVYYLTDDEPKKNKSRRSLPEWLKPVREKLAEHGINVDEEDIFITAKYDGLSCCAYTDAKERSLWLTRGDTGTNEGVDIGHVMQYIDMSGPHTVKPTDSAVQFEVMVSNGDLDELNERFGTTYKNTRSLCASILRTKDVDYRAQYLKPIPLKIYKNGQLSIHPEQLKRYPHLTCKITDIDKIRQFANENKNVEGQYRTDGLVITFLNPKVQKILGRENNVNQWEVAYKFTEEAALSHVQDIIFQVSEFGTVTPVLAITPIVMKGNTISRITLHNKARFDEMNLKYMDTVQVLYDIIPFVTLDDHCINVNKMNSNRHIPFTETCPECGKPLDLTGIFAICRNRQCPSVKVGRMINYLEVLNCKGIGYETVKRLQDIGVVTDIPTLYHIGSTKQLNIIRATHGFGELRVKMILNEIRKIKTLQDYMFFAALGIKGLNVQFFKAMFREYSVTDFNEHLIEKEWSEILRGVSGIKGIGPKKAAMLIAGLKQDRKMVQRCLRYIKLESTFGSDDTKPGIVFTGFRDRELAKELTNQGWEVQNDVTKQTTLVLCSDITSSSGSMKKAIERGIQIMTLDDWKKKQQIEHGAA